MNAFYMSPLAPWIIVASVFAVGVAILLISGRLAPFKWLLRISGGAALVLGVAMAFGAGFSGLKQAEGLKNYPAPGVFVDLDGRRGHLLCEGDGDGATAVFISGGYGQGLWLKPLHDRLKKEQRSCILDRPGVGWADAAPSPRTVEQVADETIRILEGGGEAGPFVFLGHSFGGLYAANIADIYPEKTDAIVLLDPTPPGWLFEEIARFGCGNGEPAPFMVLGAMFGLGYIDALNPLAGPGAAPLRAAIGEEDWGPLVRWELRPSSIVSAASALHAPCADPFSVVRTPGVLSDVPLLLLVQTPDADWRTWGPQDQSEQGQKNWERWAEYQRTEYAFMSSRSTVGYAPPGATHYFPIIAPDFTMAEVSTFLDGLDAPSDPASSDPVAPDIEAP